MRCLSCKSQLAGLLHTLALGASRIENKNPVCNPSATGGMVRHEIGTEIQSTPDDVRKSDGKGVARPPLTLNPHNTLIAVILLALAL